MSCKRLSPRGQSRDFVNGQMERKRQAIINNYIKAGEAAIKEARRNHKYTRQTGNLTSSIGYCILDDGEVIFGSKFLPVDGAGDKGAQEGQKFLQKLIDENSTGLVFIMVAGMNYASYVEAMSLNVLESAEQLAKRMIPKLFKSFEL